MVRGDNFFHALLHIHRFSFWASPLSCLVPSHCVSHLAGPIVS